MSHGKRSTLHVKKRQNTGFTLIELLIASSILALITLTSWRGVDMVLRTQVKILSNERSTQSTDRIFSQLDADATNIAALQNNLIGNINIYANGFSLVRKKKSAETAQTGYQVVLYVFKDSDLWRVSSPIVYLEDDIDLMLKQLSAYSLNSYETNESSAENRFNQVRMMQKVMNIEVSVFYQKDWQPRHDYYFLLAEAKLNNNTEKSQGIKFEIEMESGEVYTKTGIFGI